MTNHPLSLVIEKIELSNLKHLDFEPMLPCESSMPVCKEREPHPAHWASKLTGCECRTLGCDIAYAYWVEPDPPNTLVVWLCMKCGVVSSGQDIITRID